MLIRLVIMIILFDSFSLAAINREKININDNWEFTKGDYEFASKVDLVTSGWERIELPHTWNVWDSFDQRDGDSILDIAEYYYRGPGWYRKSITVADEEKGKRVFIEFEGANVVAELWINENYIGKHIGGYSGFIFEITDDIVFGEKNLIAVRVNNSYNYSIPPQRADYTMYGGIYRDVYLLITNQTFIENVFISTPNVSADQADISVRCILNSESSNGFTGKLNLEIFDPHLKEVESKTIDVNVEQGTIREITVDFNNLRNPELWSPTNPNLYNLRITLSSNEKVIDNVAETFGLRWFIMDAAEGFFLNGEYLKLHGVNRHQDRYGYGIALPNGLHREDFIMIREMGANFVRLAHYQQDPYVLQLCDSLGFLIWEEIPVVSSVGREKFKENAKNMLYEMITQHFNHPSIILWGLMNETIRSQPDDDLVHNAVLCKELSLLARELDPSRLLTQAQMENRGEDLFKYTDVRGWNKYFGWYYGTFYDFGDFMDEQKKINPDQPYLISEYGAGSKRGYHVEKPTFPDFSEEWSLMFHKAHWEQIKERKWIAGSAVWNMFDFASDEKAGNIPHVNQKGLVSFDRKPKDVYYFYKSQWTDDPMVYIVSHTWLDRSGAQDEKKNIEVFSNCENVELYLNGKSLGLKTAEFNWQVLFEEGENVLKAIAKKNAIRVTDEIKVNYTVN